MNAAVSMSGQRICRLAKEAAGAPDGESALRTLSLLREELDEFERQEAARAIAAGRSYSDLARALGISRQAAHRRFRHVAPGTRRAADSRLPVSSEVRLLVSRARSEAHALGATVVEPQHLLLAILRSGGRHAARALLSAGLTVEQARHQAAAATRTSQSPGAATRHALARSVSFARQDRAERVEVEHVLRGVLEAMDATPGSPLRRLEVPARRILEAIEAETPAA